MLDKKLESLLEKDSQIINSNCDYILALLDNASQPVDYSFLIAGYFKILEIELREKIFVKFSKSKTASASIFRHEEGFSKFTNENSITLGEMLLVLGSLHAVNAHGDSTRERLKLFLRGTFFRPYYLYGKQKLAERLRTTVSSYRNPAIHRKLFDRSEYIPVHKYLLGDGSHPGLLNLTIRVLGPRDSPAD